MSLCPETLNPLFLKVYIMMPLLLIGLSVLNIVQYIPLSSSGLWTAAGANPAGVPCDTCTPLFLTDLGGHVVSNLMVGAQYVIHVTFMNLGKDMNTTTVVEVRNSNDTTAWLDWHIQEARTSETVEIGMSWVPQYPQTYHIREFVLTNLTSGQILAPTITSDAVVR